MDKVLLLETKKSNLWENQSGIANKYDERYLNDNEKELIKIIEKDNKPVYAIGFYVKNPNSKIYLLEVTKLYYEDVRNITFNFKKIKTGSTAVGKFFKYEKRVSDRKILSVTNLDEIKNILERLGDFELLEHINPYSRISNQSKENNDKKDKPIKNKLDNSDTMGEMNYMYNKFADEIISIIASGLVNEKVKKWNFIKKYIVLADALVSMISFIILLIISHNSIIENTINSFCDSSKLLKDGKIDFSLALSGFVAIILILVSNIIVEYMNSYRSIEKIVLREKNRYEKYYKNNKLM